MSELLKANAVFKNFKVGSRSLQVLKGIDLSLDKGDALCIVGGSGAGKSTLLHILGGLDRPSQGSVFFKGQNISSKSDDEMARFRSRSVGFVFQFHHLLQEFSALENVAMPARLCGESKRSAQGKAQSLLAELGLRDRVHHFPSQLSGGEQQRVAIARALIQGPEILMADEPTGNLDSENDLRIQDLFFELKNSLGLTLLVVTHNNQFAARFPRVLKMKDGQWVNSEPNHLYR